MDKKIIVLILLTAIIIIGMLLTPSDENYALLRYVLNGVGLTLIPFIGAWIGIEASKFFGLKSLFGKAILFISLGMITYGIGTIIFFYYNVFLQTEIPYPSLADVGFSLTIIFINIGVFLFLKTVIKKFDFLNFLKLLIVPILVFIFVFPFFVYEKIMEEVPLFTKILNVYYVIGDILFLSFAILIILSSYGSLLFRSISIIAIGFIIQTIADFSFTYTASIGTYYTSCWVDVIYCLAFFTLGYGMYYFYKKGKETMSQPVSRKVK
jgi:hypothetical protein